jgi:uncharacterized membrane protein YtjA (UPF0391 family)
MEYALIFLLIGAIFGLVGFAAEPSPPTYLSRALFVVFLILFLVAYVHGWRITKTV